MFCYYFLSYCWHSVTRHHCLFAVCASVCTSVFLNEWAWLLDAEIESTAYMLFHLRCQWGCMTVCSPGRVCVCVRTDVCYLKLVGLLLLPDHNSTLCGCLCIFFFLQTHTQYMCVYIEADIMEETHYIYVHAWVPDIHTHAQLLTVTHRLACLLVQWPTHMCLVEAAIMGYYKQWTSPYVSSQFQSEWERTVAHCSSAQAVHGC